MHRTRLSLTQYIFVPTRCFPYFEILFITPVIDPFDPESEKITGICILNPSHGGMNVGPIRTGKITAKASK